MTMVNSGLKGLIHKNKMLPVYYQVSAYNLIAGFIHVMNDKIQGLSKENNSNINHNRVQNDLILPQ